MLNIKKIFCKVLSFLLMIVLLTTMLPNMGLVFADVNTLVEENFEAGMIDKTRWDFISGAINVIDDGEGNKVGMFNEKDSIGWSRLEGYNYTDGVTAICFKLKLVENKVQVINIQFRNRQPDIDQYMNLIAINNGEVIFAPSTKQSVKLQDVELNKWYDFKILVDGRADAKAPAKVGVYIDGVLKQQMTDFVFVDSAGTKKLNSDILKGVDGTIRAPELRFSIQPKVAGESEISYIDDIKVYKTEELPPEAPKPAMENIQFKLDPTFMYQPGEMNYDVIINHVRDQELAGYSITATVKSKVDGSIIVYDPVTVEAVRNTSIPVNIKLNDIHKKGVYTITWDVKYEDESVGSFSTNFAIMTDYVPQFMDEYTQFGIDTHIDKTPADYLNTEISIMNKVGFKLMRSGFSWANLERVKGVYDFDRMDSVIQPVLDSGIQWYYPLAFNNPAYFTKEESNGAGNMFGPISKENIEGFVNFAVNVAQRYPEIKLFEIWNEPDHKGFWAPEPDPVALANLLKATSMAIKKVNPDAKVIAHTIGLEQNKNFTSDYFKQEALEYSDAYAAHMYFPESGPDPEAFIERLNYNQRTALNEFGGWKDVYLSETGFTMVKSSNGVTEEQMADYLVKRFVSCEADGQKNTMSYDLKDDGTDPYNKEHMFGMLYNDYSPKLAVVAFHQMMQKIQGARYIGQLDAGEGNSIHIYSKEGNPIAVAWTKDSAREFDFGENVTVEDQYGNVCQEGPTVTFDSQTKYVLGLSKNWFQKASGNTISDEYDKWLKKWLENAEIPQMKKVKKEIEDLKNYADIMKQASALPSDTEIEAKLDEHYKAGEELIKLQKQNKLDMTQEEAMLMLYELQTIGERWADYLSVLVSPDAVPEQLISTGIIEKFEKELNKEKNKSEGYKRYTQDIFAIAKEFSEIADNIRSADSSYKAGIMTSYDLVASHLVSWADMVNEFETGDVTHDVLIQANPTNVKLYGSDGSANVKINVTNNQDTVLNGSIGIYDENDVLIGEAKALAIESGLSELTEFTVVLKDKNIVGNAVNYYIKIMKNGKEFKKQVLPVTIEDKLSAALTPSADTVDELEQITVDVDALSDKEFTGEISVTPPEGWTIDENSKSIHILPGESAQMNFKIDGIQKNDFNQYVFNVVIKDSSGETVLSKDIPLSFVVSVKAQNMIEPGNFDGNIESWEDAYPVFLNPPSDPGNPDEWKNSNMAGIAYTKWDENYFYVLADVFDNVHNVLTAGKDSWNGDCLQLSFDPLNTRSVKSYDGDDYEYTFSLHPVGEQVYAYKVAEGKQFGVRPAEWTRIIRDEANKTTRYYIRIPKSELEPLSLIENTQMGMNIAIGDGDMVNRDSFCELTPGTAAKKDPSVYYSWILTN